MRVRTLTILALATAGPALEPSQAQVANIEIGNNPCAIDQNTLAKERQKAVVALRRAGKSIRLIENRERKLANKDCKDKVLLRFYQDVQARF